MVKVHRVLSLIALALAAASLAPSLLAAQGVAASAPVTTTPAAVTTEGADLYGLDAALALEAAGLVVERSVGRDVADPGTTLVPDHEVQADLGDVAPTDLPVDAALGLAALREKGATTSHPLSAQVASSGPAYALASPVVAIAAASGFALVAAALWLWPHLKKVALLGLFAHIGRAEVFDNEVRERVFALIRAEPGIHATDIATKTGVSWGTALYHLEVLEQNAMVAVHKDGRYRRYFVSGAGVEKQMTSVLRNERTAGVRDTIAGRPGLTQKELSEAVGMSPQALHWHVVRLDRAGLVRKERDGRTVRHFVA